MLIAFSFAILNVCNKGAISQHEYDHELVVAMAILTYTKHNLRTCVKHFEFIYNIFHNKEI